MREGFVEKSSTLTKQIGDMAVIQSGMPQQSGVLGNADPITMLILKLFITI